jgi:transposase-like protein
MPQHFLLSSAAKTLTLGSVVRMSDSEVERTFIRLRWHDSDGKPRCPKCTSETVWEGRRDGNLRWQCKACHREFTLTSGTLFASRKMPLRGYLMAIAIFINEVKGKSMLALSRDLGTSYKAAFVLAHKIREALASEVRAGEPLGGDGKRAEVDGGYFGGYVKPANRRENRRDRRLAVNQSGKRRVVVIIRERGPEGKALPGVFRNEADAVEFIRKNLAPQTRLYADEAASWNDLHSKYELERINHQDAYSLPGGVYTNNAESFFSRMRRAEIGHHHHVAGPYLIRFAQEAAWRENNRRVSNGKQVDQVVTLAMRHKPSVDFAGYWQRHIKDAAE